MAAVNAEIHTDRSALVSWLVAAGLAAYYLLPLFTRWNTGRPLGWDIAALLVLPAVVAAAALPCRYSHPTGTVLVQAVCWALSPAVIGPAVVAQAHCASRHGRRDLAVVTGLALLAGKGAQLALYPGRFWSSASTVEAVVAVAGITVATLVGLLDRSRREAESSRVRAEEARRTSENARIEAARLAERERLAREMHDVVAHRISLIAMQAGAMRHRRDLPVEQLRETADLIVSNAQASLDELRVVLTTLRGSQASPEPPQPTLADLDDLIGDARAGGQSISLCGDASMSHVPQQVSRHAYRILQEALTNARKHAPGAPVSVRVATVGNALEVEVRNPISDLAPPNPGAGLGLVGIAERVAILHGNFVYHLENGGFRLLASLPLKEAP